LKEKTIAVTDIQNTLSKEMFVRKISVVYDIRQNQNG
jgi:hypothetical protein